MKKFVLSCMIGLIGFGGCQCETAKNSQKYYEKMRNK
jgi:hypothetical protein